MMESGLGWVYRSRAYFKYAVDLLVWSGLTWVAFAIRFGGRGGEVAFKPVICDVRDRTSLERVFEAERPDVVFHAAAHKHAY